jgi:hypothetical protein
MKVSIALAPVYLMQALITGSKPEASLITFMFDSLLAHACDAAFYAFSYVF